MYCLKQEKVISPVHEKSFSSGYASVNGLEMYYEIHGTGQPLVLLHGGFGSTGMFGEALTLLSKERRVIVAGLQGHGRTADIDRSMSCALLLIGKHP